MFSSVIFLHLRNSDVHPLGDFGPMPKENPQACNKNIFNSLSPTLEFASLKHKIHSLVKWPEMTGKSYLLIKATHSIGSKVNFKT